jgi:hypothetical protein
MESDDIELPFDFDETSTFGCFLTDRWKIETGVCIFTSSNNNFDLYRAAVSLNTIRIVVFHTSRTKKFRKNFIVANLLGLFITELSTEVEKYTW